MCFWTSEQTYEWTDDVREEGAKAAVFLNKMGLNATNAYYLPNYPIRISWNKQITITIHTTKLKIKALKNWTKYLAKNSFSQK